MYGFISGTTDTDDMRYCPKCGEEIREWKGDGTAVCGVRLSLRSSRV